MLTRHSTTEPSSLVIARISLTHALFTFLSVPVSLFLYAFPVLFNIIPGTLDLAERIFGFDLGATSEPSE